MKTIGIVILIAGLAISMFDGLIYMTGGFPAGEVIMLAQGNATGPDPFFGVGVTLIGITLMFIAAQKPRP